MKKINMKRILSFCLAIAIAFTTIVIALPGKVSAGLASGNYANNISERVADSAKNNYTVNYSVKVVNDRNADAKFDLNTKKNNGTSTSSEYYDNSNSVPFNKGINISNTTWTSHQEKLTGTNFPEYVLVQAENVFGDFGVDYKLKDLKLEVNGTQILASLNADSTGINNATKVTHEERIGGFLGIGSHKETVFDYYHFETYNPTQISVPKSVYPYLNEYYAGLSTNTVNIPKTGSTVVNTTFKGVDQYGVKYSNDNVTYSLSENINGVTINPTTGVVSVTKDANQSTKTSVDVIATVATANSTKQACIVNIGKINLVKTNYTVTFNDYDGTQIGNPQTIVYGDNATAPADPTRTGYNFTGWDKSFNAITDDTVVTAVYSNPITYTVTFIADGSTVDTAVYTVEDKNITEPTVPAKAGYTGAWESYTLTNGNKVVNAVYSPVTYTATFKADGVTVGLPQDFNVENKDTAVVAPEIPSKAGYTAAWDVYTLGASDITINAVYTPITYTVTFVNGDNTTTTANYTVENKNVVNPTIVEKIGYTAAWETYDLNVLGDKTVNATYKAIDYTAIYVVDGQTVAEVPFTVETADSVIAPAIPEKTGYTGTWEAYTLGADNAIINAIYTINQYTVTFNDGYTSTPISTQEVDYGTAATAPTNPTRTGYNFAGWDVEFDNVTDNTTVTAKWTLAPVVVVDDETPLASVPETDKTNNNDKTNTANDGKITLTDETPLAATNTADNTNIIAWCVSATVATCGSVVLVKKKSKED